jgi:hypothetical protein
VGELYVRISPDAIGNRRADYVGARVQERMENGLMEPSVVFVRAVCGRCKFIDDTSDQYRCKLGGMAVVSNGACGDFQMPLDEKGGK